MKADEKICAPAALQGKKLLILGGIIAHTKVVEAARQMGVYTIVTDYLQPDSSPAKKAADEYWMISYADVEAVTQKCRECGVDGVLTFSHESSQIPYYHICRELGLPCYGELRQFESLTNKRLFKQLCQENGISVIPEYSPEEALRGDVAFPVMVKPVDRCGSNGLTLCADMDELKAAVRAAQEESISGDVIIEKYLPGMNSFQVTYFFADGRPYLIRTVDGYKGLLEQKLDRVALCSVSPSAYTDEYLYTTHEPFVNMLRSLGIQNGPVMAQGFYDRGEFRFYDPGRRFPGTEFERLYRDLFGVDLMKMMVVFALTGEMPPVPETLKNDNVYLNDEKAVVLFPTIRPGVIGEIKGYVELKADPRIRNVCQKHVEGAVIKQENTVSQRIFEIDFIADSDREAKEMIKEMQSKIYVADELGNPMIEYAFDAERIK